MIARLAVFALLVPLVLSLAPSAITPAAHYVPHAGDALSFAETITVGGGFGDYTGYSETTYVNGTLSVTATLPNGTESATFSYVEHYVNSTGASDRWTSAGSFTFSATTFHYVVGTDNQTGYTNPYVWFFMNNSTPVGGTFFLLNTRFSVEATAFAYPLNTPAGAYVSTIRANGNGSFYRNDSYGMFTADYLWDSFFDPATGYIVGYDYVEHDANVSGDGFTLSDALKVTNTTYPLTMTSAPPAPAAPFPWEELLAALAGVVVVLAVVAAVLFSRRRRLPVHPATGRFAYSVPPPGPPPPPISLIPGDQPKVQQIVIKETVKVNCRYCGSLIDSTAPSCPFCGATRT